MCAKLMQDTPYGAVHGSLERHGRPCRNQAPFVAVFDYHGFRQSLPFKKSKKGEMNHE